MRITEPAWVKVYPILGFAAIRKGMGGAWRAWTVARSIDSQGSGFIGHKTLRQELIGFGVGKRQQRRWISAALKAGFFKPIGQVYYLAGIVKVALSLNVVEVGLPAYVESRVFMAKAWRARIWSAYLLTLHQRPVAQNTKRAMTGILPRTQQRYQKIEPGSARANYARTNLRRDQVPGMVENEGGAYFTARNGRIYKRLPDIRLADDSSVRSAPRGRSRKVQKLLSSSEGRDPKRLKLFAKNVRELNATEKQHRRSDLLPWHKPIELFQLLCAGDHSNIWTMVPVAVTF